MRPGRKQPDDPYAATHPRSPSPSPHPWCPHPSPASRRLSRRGGRLLGEGVIVQALGAQQGLLHGRPSGRSGGSVGTRGVAAPASIRPARSCGRGPAGAAPPPRGHWRRGGPAEPRPPMATAHGVRARVRAGLSRARPRRRGWPGLDAPAGPAGRAPRPSPRRPRRGPRPDHPGGDAHSPASLGHHCPRLPLSLLSGGAGVLPLHLGVHLGATRVREAQVS